MSKIRLCLFIGWFMFFMSCSNSNNTLNYFINNKHPGRRIESFAFIDHRGQSFNLSPDSIQIIKNRIANSVCSNTINGPFLSKNKVKIILIDNEGQKLDSLLSFNYSIFFYDESYWSAPRSPRDLR